MGASVTVGVEAIVVEVVEHTAACCAAAKAVTAGVAPATYAMEGSHGLGSGLQEACPLGPFLMDPCLGAYQCSVGGDASDQAALAHAAEPWETEPCCLGEEIEVDMFEGASAGPASVVSEQTCHTGCWASARMSKGCEVIARPAKPAVPGHPLQSLDGWSEWAARAGESICCRDIPCGSFAAARAAC